MSGKQVLSVFLQSSLQRITITDYIKISINYPRIKHLDKILKHCIPLPTAVILGKYKKYTKPIYAGLSTKPVTKMLKT